MAIEGYLILIFLVSCGIGCGFIASVGKNMYKPNHINPLMFVYLIPCLVGLSTLFICEYDIINLPMLLVGLCLFFIVDITTLVVSEFNEHEGTEFNSDFWFIIVTCSSMLFMLGVCIGLSI